MDVLVLFFAVGDVSGADRREGLVVARGEWHLRRHGRPILQHNDLSSAMTIGNNLQGDRHRDSAPSGSHRCHVVARGHLVPREGRPYPAGGGPTPPRGPGAAMYGEFWAGRSGPVLMQR